MIYKSRNGCLFYYDRILYKWQVADPTMLFLLGLESVTTYDNSESDSLTIASNIYIQDIGEYIPFYYFEIYDNIISYLSQFTSVTDNQTYITANLNGLKLLLNDLTGTGKDRTIPIIFKNDINKSIIDLTRKLSRVENFTDKSYYDLQAQKIYDIFADANYTGNSTDYTSAEKLSNSQIYKLLDFKAMYSYALGVLYGCRCLGFSPELIWHMLPRFWYTGELKNLVNSAWYTIQFYHTKILENESNLDKLNYRSIEFNRLWNYGFDPDIDKNATLPLVAGETPVFKLSKENSTVSIKILNYIPTLPPSQIFINESGNVVKQQLDLNPATDGLSELTSNPAVYYFGANKVNLFFSYNNICPNITDCFTPTGDIGWFKALSESGKLSSDLRTNSYLPDAGKSKLYINTSTNDIVRIISYTLTPDDSDSPVTLYGLYYDQDTGYSKTLESSIDGYSQLPDDVSALALRTYYNITDIISVYTYTVNNTIYIWDNNTATQDLTESEFLNLHGYSKTPSTTLEVYSYSYDTGLISTLYKFNQDTLAYWSSSEWSTEPPNGYLKSDTSINLYAATMPIAKDIATYISILNPLNKFIFNDNTIDYLRLSHIINYGFISLESSEQSLYNLLGVTEYICPVISTDTNDNSLLDTNGSPLVWEDRVKYPDYSDNQAKRYWSKLSIPNRWQSYIPVMSGAQVYDSSLNTIMPAIDNIGNNTVTISNEIISYNDFYNES